MKNIFHKNLGVDKLTENGMPKCLCPIPWIEKCDKDTKV